MVIGIGHRPSHPVIRAYQRSRERMVVVKIIPYLASKWVVLGTFNVIQSVILLGIIHWQCQLKGPWEALYVFMLLNALFGTGLGLLLSAISKTAERAMGLLAPVVLRSLSDRGFAPMAAEPSSTSNG